MSFTPYAPMPFYPGPVSLYPAVAAALGEDYGPPRTGDAYLRLYKETQTMMQGILGTTKEIIMPTGEGMLGLWGAMKSVLRPGDRVLSVGTGVFGDGFGDMALMLGCEVEKISLPYNSTIDAAALEQVDAALKKFQPLLMTAVHCETPSGTLNPMEGLARLKKDRNVPLFAVDAVASMGGAPVHTDAWNVDILMGGSQKCMGCPPDMSVLAVSEAAWEIMSRVNYVGYEALLPFHNATDDPMRFPYTPHWRGVAALHAACAHLMAEGLDKVFARHEAVAARCRQGLRDMGMELWTAPEAVNSPTVTAALVPQGKEWLPWRDSLIAKGLYPGGSLGPMAGKVFRMGHMGPQADMARLEAALTVIKNSL